MRLAYQDLVPSAISRSHLKDDVRGINASIALIQKARGGGWPTEPVSEEYDFVDLVWHELELSAELLDYDVDVSWWVTPSAYDDGYYTKLYDALRHWITSEFSFWRPYFSNIDVPEPR